MIENNEYDGQWEIITKGDSTLYEQHEAKCLMLLAEGKKRASELLSSKTNTEIPTSISGDGD